MEQIARQPDYLDNLLPGYRFCPTDSELILYYLKRKIETGEHPKCRIYEVNLYNYSPEQLAGNHRACDDKWYFLTSRERKYVNGDVPNRKTGDFGLWKTTQRSSPIYDDATGQQVIGRKRSLAYYVKKDCKTPWLMHEYTMDDPNLPVGSGKKVLTEWVLCAIYKKKKKITVKAPHQMFAGEEVNVSLANSTGEYQQSHSNISITANSSQLSHGASASTSINPHANGASSSTLFEPHAHAIHPVAYASPISHHIIQQNHSMSTTTNSGFQFPNGASSSTLLEPYTHHDGQLPACTSPLTSLKRFQFSNESLADAPQDVPMDDYDHFFQHDDYGTTGSVADEDIMDFDVSKYISLDELLGPQSDP